MDINRKFGIYCIVNLITKMLYIGSTNNLHKRKVEHFRNLRNNKHNNAHLQYSYNKYGRKNFKFIILEYIINQNDLIDREQSWLDSFEKSQKYNILNNAGTPLGYKHTEEAKRKISKANIGKQVTEQTRKKLSKINTGRSPSKKTREKQSKAKQGKNNPNWGKERSEETKRKISNSVSGENNFNFGKSGGNHPKAKSVKQIDIKTNKIIKVWDSITEASQALNINNKHISSVCTGNRKSAGGYFWEHA